MKYLLYIPVLSIPLWFIAFPNTSWFMKIWASLTTAFFLYSWIDHFNPNNKRRPREPKPGAVVIGKRTTKFQYYMGLIVATAFGIVSLGIIAPDFYFQETHLEKIRGLSADSVDKVFIELSDGSEIVADNTNGDLLSFLKLTNGAYLFYPNHENSQHELSLTLAMTDGRRITYPTRVPERHKEDISLDFCEYVLCDEIIIPNGWQWLEESLQNYKL